MAYWKFKKEAIPNEWNELEEDNLVCFVGDDGVAIETMSYVDDDDLTEGVVVSRSEKLVIHYLSKVFGLLSAIDFVTAVRFDVNAEGLTPPRFLLQTDLSEHVDDMEFFDDDDVLDELKLKRLSISDYCEMVGKGEDDKMTYADYFFLRSVNKGD